MDPKLAPNFVRPSDKRPTAYRSPAPAQASLIPNIAPIQPYVLEDSQHEIDLPQDSPRLLPSRTNSRDSLVGLEQIALTLKHHHHKTANYHPAPVNIPRIRSELNMSDSSPDRCEKIDEMDCDVQTSFSKFSLGDQVPPPATVEEAMAPTSPQSPKEPQVHAATGTADSSSRTPPYLLDNSGLRPIIQSADLEEVPIGVSRQARDLEHYKFPTHRLSEVMIEESKSPLVIVACGSFSPITYLHLRMFEMAMDSIREQTRFEVIGGYYSPVSDNYNKPGLAPAHHRVRMCELACERTSSWLMVDAWESLQPTYQRTATVLDHFNEEINIKRGGIKTVSGKRKGVKIMLLAGGDLIESMGEPNVWEERDLHHILGRYGCLIVERTGADVRSFLLSHDIMYEHRRNVLVIKQLIYNDISSTKVRLFIRRGMSVQYLIPNSVIRYIQEHRLYVGETEPVKQVLYDRE
ncbi:Nicotinamide/nicotinic acid mononucleotide adenylyltransferase 1 [Yarrowia sp. C11]|nr:Nicotinamide/nicotinic acid mononucleotide adenylyltransferase 1 [Yarrowia sp. C11]KAG5370644.1 Nicotinamide/nicotinic acid mononucleotide adenylyltransferase 1 [Yarrowia sp. E02]